MSGTPWVGVLGEPRPISPARVRIECERMVSGEPRVTLRNLTRRPLEVELRGLAYAGRTGVRNGNSWSPVGIWEPWWRQEAIRLSPRGSRSARIFELRIEKLEARDRRGRLLASFNLKEDLPELNWGMMIVAVHPGGDWRPFGAARAGSWVTIRPSMAWTDLTDYFPLPIRIIADAPAEAFSEEQLDALREMVESGRTLILCGRVDRERLLGWERAGLLAHPARGVRRLPGLRDLARLYEVPPVAASIDVADTGRVLPPRRVLLEEQGVPLVIEQRRGLGRLLFVTFDPTRPPFRNTRLEQAFWREWATPPDDEFRYISVNAETAPAYQRVRRDLGLTPPSVRMVAGLWLGYLLVLGVVLATTRRRIRGVAIVSVAGSAVALMLGPLLRSAVPVAAFAGGLSLRSGDARGRWRGAVEVMMPAAGSPALRVPSGRLRMGEMASLTAGESFMAVIAAAALLILTLMATVPAASLAFSRERERHALDPLLLTRLSPRAIVLGKLAQAGLVPLLATLAVLPLLCLSLCLGGVEPGPLAGAVGFLLLCHLLFAATALCGSGWCRRSIVAMVCGYLVVLLLFGGPLLAAASAVPRGGPPPAWATALLGLSPLIGLLDLATPLTAAAVANPEVPMAAAGCGVYALLILVSLALAVRGLRPR